MATALTISALSKKYGQHTALQDVSLAVPAGTLTALLGPNGAGKSTLVNCCTGLIRPTSGQVLVHGKPAFRSAAARAQVGVMLQSGGLPAQTKPLPYLRYLARFYTSSRNVTELADRLGITDFADRTIRRMSGGQRGRVAFAAAILGRPDIVFLDEPTTGLDATSRDEVYSVINEVRAQGCAIVLTTHNMPEASALADYVAVMNHGRLIAEGKPADFTSQFGELNTSFATDPGLSAQEVAAALPNNLIVTETTGGEVTITGQLSTADYHELTGLALARGVHIRHLQTRSASLEEAVSELTTTS